MSLSKNRLNLIMLFPLIMISLFCSVFTFSGLNSLQIGTLVSAQIADSDPIQITSTSAYTDELGNFHIIGEVNNTSTQSQTDIVITAIPSDTSNNTVVGNYTAFSSISTLRQGELSPFDIVIQNPQQILGKFDFMEFSTTSQPATEEKPANLVINGSSSFLDNAGNPHITGNIINQGQTPEQFLNLVATFYDNSSLGVIGTQTFGLNVENLANNQMAPFDITITDNKTKSQGAFYSLNVESTRSSLDFPINSKTSFASTGGFTGNSAGEGLTNSLPLNNQPGFVISNDDDSRTRDNDDDGNGDNQRGEKKTDDEGNPWFDDDNCSEKSGSSGGSSSECEEAEREEESEREDEDSLEKDQGPPSNSGSDSTNDNNDEGENNDGNDTNGDENTGNDKDNGDVSSGNDEDNNDDSNN